MTTMAQSPLRPVQPNPCSSSSFVAPPRMIHAPGKQSGSLKHRVGVSRVVSARASRLPVLPQLQKDVMMQQQQQRDLQARSSKSQRAVVDHTYHDHLHDPFSFYQNPYGRGSQCQQRGRKTLHLLGDIQHHPSDCTEQGEEGREGLKSDVTIPFPEKLHRMLSHVEAEGLDHIISWQPHGRAFQIHRKNDFVTTVMPLFFRQSKLTSFQRQLNLYGFLRLSAGGPDRGSYYHELFLRGRRDLCRQMIRTRIKGNGMKASSSPMTEPDFYAMEHCPKQTAKADRQLQLNHPALSLSSHPNSAHSEPAGQCCTESSLSDEDTATMMTASDHGPSQTITSNHSCRSDEDEDFEEDVGPAPCTGVLVSSTPSSDDKFPFSSISLRRENGETAHSDTASASSEGEGPAHSKNKMIPIMDSAQSNLTESCSMLPTMLGGALLPLDHRSTSDGNNSKSRVLHTGDEVYFEGLKFRYLDQINLKDLGTII